jgi:hypothetical protein
LEKGAKKKVRKAGSMLSFCRFLLSNIQMDQKEGENGCMHCLFHSLHTHQGHRNRKKGCNFNPLAHVNQKYLLRLSSLCEMCDMIVRCLQGLNFFNKEMDAFESALLEKVGQHGYPSWYTGLCARGIEIRMIADGGDIMLRFSFSEELELLQVGKTIYTHHQLDQMDSRFSNVGNGIRSIDAGVS